MFASLWYLGTRRARAIAKRHEAIKDMAAMVFAQIRLCAAGVPCALDRVRGLARFRPRADPAIARSNLRYLPGPRSPGQDPATGHDCRYRREEPRRSEA